MLKYQVISMLNVNQYGETYCIKVRNEDMTHQTKDQVKESEKAVTSGENANEDYHILKVIDKTKFFKKERPTLLRQINDLLFIDNSSVSNIAHFFMSTDFFYFVMKMKTV